MCNLSRKSFLGGLRDRGVASLVRVAVQAGGEETRELRLVRGLTVRLTLRRRRLAFWLFLSFFP